MWWGNQCVCKQICCWLWCVDTAHTQTALKTVRSLKSPIKNRAGPNDSATQKHWITVQTALQEKKHRPWSYKEAASKTKLRPTWTLVHRRAWKYRNRHTGSPMLRPSLRVQHRITRVRRKVTPKPCKGTSLQVKVLLLPRKLKAFPPGWTKAKITIKLYKGGATCTLCYTKKQTNATPNSQKE